MASSYECKYCEYKTNIKCNYDKHLITDKHIKNKENSKKYICKYCNKKYTHQSGLYRHQSKCKEEFISNQEHQKLKQKNENKELEILRIENEKLKEQNQEYLKKLMRLETQLYALKYSKFK